METVRAFAVVLLALSACAGKSTPPAGDPSDFCGIPVDVCGHRLIDEEGHVHVVTCSRTDAGQ